MPEAVCTVWGGSHRMVSMGFASVKDSSGKNIESVNGGGWYKCNCGQRFIASSHPHFGYPIGYYVTEGGIIQQTGGTSGWGTFIVNRSYVYYTTSTSLPGFIFLDA